MAWTAAYRLVALPSVLCNALANLLFVRALQLSDPSLTIPYFTPVLALLSSWLVVGEIPAASGIAGVAVIGLGALVLNPAVRTARASICKALREERQPGHAGRRLSLEHLRRLRQARPRAQSAHRLHCGVGGHGAPILNHSAATVRCRLARAAASGRRILMVTTLVITAALIAQLWSYHYVPVAYVEAIKRSLGMVGAVAVGWWFFNEGSTCASVDHGRRRVLDPPHADRPRHYPCSSLSEVRWATPSTQQLPTGAAIQPAIDVVRWYLRV